jgi:hypothetical protein
MFAAGCKADASVKVVAAHRWLYEYLIAPLRAIRVTHTCTDRTWVNPWHLRVIDTPLAVAIRPNAHCKQGHPCTKGYTYVVGNHRICKPCRLSYLKERREQRKPRSVPMADVIAEVAVGQSGRLDLDYQHLSADGE